MAEVCYTSAIMLTKDDLLGLGISPGPMFAKIFKAAKNAKNKAEAVSIAIAIRDGTFVRKTSGRAVIDPNSVLHWCLERRHLFPNEQEKPGDVSISAVQRMLDQGAITINGKKPKGDHPMEFPVWEVVFFKGANRQCTQWFDMELAPMDANWRTSKMVLDANGRLIHTWGEWITKEKWLEKQKSG